MNLEVLESKNIPLLLVDGILSVVFLYLDFNYILFQMQGKTMEESSWIFVVYPQTPILQDSLPLNCNLDNLIEQLLH